MDHTHILSEIGQRLFRAIGFNHTSIRGKNNRLVNRGNRTGVSLKIEGNNNYIEIGQGTKLSNLTISITGDNHRIVLGENCIYKRGGIAMEDSYGELTIGSDTTIEGAAFSVSEPGSKITVGQDCMFSYGIRIRVSDAHSVIDLKTKERTNYAKNVSIGDHVWIGPSAIILKGVKIGESAVVGAGAVVTKNVAPCSIVAGNPAQLVRENISWTRSLTYYEQSAGGGDSSPPSSN